MAPLDWSRCSAVERIPGTVSGAWVFQGTRTPVAIVFENLEDGMTIDEVLEQFPVSREQMKAVLEFAARSLDAPSRAADASSLRQRHAARRRVCAAGTFGRRSAVSRLGYARKTVNCSTLPKPLDSMCS
jgi:uncharacterized protein (DUF433 family)